MQRPSVAAVAAASAVVVVAVAAAARPTACVPSPAVRPSTRDFGRSRSSATARRRARRGARPAPSCPLRRRDAILAELAAKRVLVICGETGCGKSTQVPQFLLECAARAGASLSLLGGGDATSAHRGDRTGRARRGGARRTRRRLGGLPGEGRREARPSTRLLYCTTGVLLRRLQSDAHMRGVSHVVIDEVHERGIDSDFLLIILKAALASPHAARRTDVGDGRRRALRQLLWRAKGDVDADDPGAHLPD